MMIFRWPAICLCSPMPCEINRLVTHLFIYFIGVLSPTQDYFICITVVNIEIEGNRTTHEQTNWQTFSSTPGLETSIYSI